MLWFVVKTDLTITTEKLVELFATMDDQYVADQYVDYHVSLYGFHDGVDNQLKLPQSKVAEIKTNYRSYSQRRDALLDLYTTTHPCPSWRQVAKVLRGVDLPHQARVVENTYVQGTMIILIHSFCVHYYHRMC